MRTFAGASDVAAREFAALFGAADLDADQIDRAREIIVDSGAHAHVEGAIEREYATALAALDAAGWLAEPARAGLANLAAVASHPELRVVEGSVVDSALVRSLVLTGGTPGGGRQVDVLRHVQKLEAPKVARGPRRSA